MTLGRRTVRKPPNEDCLLSTELDPAIEQRLTDLQAKLDVLKAQVRQAQQLAGLGTAAATIAHEHEPVLRSQRSDMTVSIVTVWISRPIDATDWP